MASRDLDPAEVQPLLDDPDLPFRGLTTTLLKNSRTTTVAETTMMVRGCPTQVIYKRFNRKKWLDPLLTLFRPSRAWRSWQAGQHLVSRGIPHAAEPGVHLAPALVPAAPLFWFLPHETYLITVKEQNVVDLGTYARKVLPGLAPEVRRARIRGLTVVACRAGPLAPRSVALASRPESLEHLDQRRCDRTAEYQLSLIDLVGVRLRHPIPREPAGPEPGAAVHQPGRGPGPNPDRLRCGSFAFTFPGACRRSTTGRASGGRSRRGFATSGLGTCGADGHFPDRMGDEQ